MRPTIRTLCIPAILLLSAIGSIGRTGSPPAADSHASIMIVFQDGHRQNVAMAEIARIDFNTPVSIVF